MTQHTKIFKRVALIGRQRRDGIADTLIALTNYLQQHGCQVIFEQETAQLLHEAVSSVPSGELHKHCDLIIVVGGDGSMLRAAHIAANQQVPVLGVNRGRLGFLTDIYPHELDKIGHVLMGYYREEIRFLLTANIKQNNKIMITQDALNEVVLLPGNVAHMIEFDIYINQDFVCSQRADGLIVATPTGSTAYALSGGGPILHPNLDAMVLVPMFPHTLSNRPIVVESDSVIMIKIAENNETAPYISCDGQERVHIEPGNLLEINKKIEKLHLIHPLDYNYYDTLRVKLRWQK